MSKEEKEEKNISLDDISHHIDECFNKLNRRFDDIDTKINNIHQVCNVSKESFKKELLGKNNTTNNTYGAKFVTYGKMDDASDHDRGQHSEEEDSDYSSSDDDDDHIRINTKKKKTTIKKRKNHSLFKSICCCCCDNC